MKKWTVVLAIGAIFTFLRVITFAEPPANINSKVKMSFPGKKWALQIELPNLEITGNKISEDSQARTVRGVCKLSGEDEIEMSIFLEKAREEGDAKVFRDYYWNNLKKHPATPSEEEVTMSEKNDMATLEYIINEYQEVTIDQKNLNMYIVNDDIWVGIHLSKVQWKESDQPSFDKILNSVKLEKLDDKKVMKYNADFNKQFQAAVGYCTQKQWKDAEQALLEVQKTAPNVSLVPFWQGNNYYYQKSLANAIKYYEQMLGLEDGNRFMTDKLIRVVIDNLGMAYGMSNNLKKAEEAFQGGVKRYPFYPHFYYKLACVYAEGKNSKKALDYLELAFKKAEEYKNEELPNALNDSSFKALQQDKRFMELLKKYKSDK